jgi:protein-L-isoaspartate(D-aspartate) O-methyltransferase
MAAETLTGRREKAAELIRQLRLSGISDERVLGAIADVPRERFVDPSLAADAYRNEPLPIECGQTISAPFIVAYMSEKLDVHPDHDVLEVGTGSGYQAAILARLAWHVYTIERHGALLDRARAIFRDLDIDNITAAQGDGSAGWAEARTFDRIIVTARARKMPEALIDQLKEGGRMILPLGRWPWQEKLVLLTKTLDGLQRENLLPVRFVPLVSG